MLFRLKTGRIVVAGDVNIAYEIVKGRKPHDDQSDFEKWLIWIGAEPVEEEKITIRDLIAGGCKIGAVRKYRDEHRCTLREAKDKIDEMIAKGKVDM